MYIQKTQTSGLITHQLRPSHCLKSQINNRKPTRIWRYNAPANADAMWQTPYR